jgi:hypothetical protein
MTHSPRILLVLALAGLSLLGACASSSLTSAEGKDTTATPQRSVTPKAKATRSPTAPGTSVAASTAPGTAGGEGGAGAASGTDFCQIARALQETSSSSSGAEESPGAFYKRAAEAADQLVKAAPAEIKGDVEIVAQGLKKLNEQLEKVGYDVSKLSPEATQFSSDPAFAAASERVTRYITDQCGQ